MYYFLPKGRTPLIHFTQKKESSQLEQLLAMTSNKQLLKPDNYQLFVALKEALTLDGKAINPDKGADISVNFESDINSSYDFYRKQGKLITLLIEQYANQVLHPMFIELNELSSNEFGSVYVNGGCFNGSLKTRNAAGWSEGFLGNNRALWNTLKQWEHCLTLIGLHDVIFETLKSHAVTITHDDTIDVAIDKAMQ